MKHSSALDKKVKCRPYHRHGWDRLWLNLLFIPGFIPGVCRAVDRVMQCKCKAVCACIKDM